MKQKNDPVINLSGKLQSHGDNVVLPFRMSKEGILRFEVGIQWRVAPMAIQDSDSAFNEGAGGWK